MQKREKIIVILAILAAVYGVVDFTLSRQPKKGGGSQAQPEGLSIAEIAGQLSTLSSAESQKIARLAASINDPWQEQVFVLRGADFGSPKETDEPSGPDVGHLKDQASQLVYSGFLAMGADRIAIINGMDYRVGEQINGFTITKISQEAVQVSQQTAFFDIPASIELDSALSIEKAHTP